MGSCLSIAPTSKIENDNNLHPSSNPPMTPTLHIPPPISSYNSSIVPPSPHATLSVSQTPLNRTPIYIPQIQHLNIIKNNNRNSNYFESNNQSNYYHYGNHLGFDYIGGDGGGGGCD